jgi:hypothetical protein
MLDEPQRAKKLNPGGMLPLRPQHQTDLNQKDVDPSTRSPLPDQGEITLKTHPGGHAISVLTTFIEGCLAITLIKEKKHI